MTPKKTAFVFACLMTMWVLTLTDWFNPRLAATSISDSPRPAQGGIGSDGTYDVKPREVIVQEGQSLSEALQVNDSTAAEIAASVGLTTKYIQGKKTTLIYEGDVFLLLPDSLDEGDSAWAYVPWKNYN
ncbi:MAG TPA: hypothetical protein PKZ56_00995 [Candidatus Paceibacterota bacterium]|jgi:hypothetical protein|nr:hypothetical protein [Candidatus Paceibacterota bacterium]